MRLSLYFLAVLLLVSGCATPSIAQRSRALEGSGTPGSRTEDARGVHDVSLSVPGTLVIEVGRDAPLRIEGDANIVGALVIDRDGNELEIRAPRRTNLRPNRPLRLRMGVASLESVSVAGRGQIEAAGISADDFDASVAGSGTIILGGLDARTVAVSIAGSGAITIDGQAEELDLSIAGSGDADVEDLAVYEADISIAGSGNAFVNVSELLSASIVGSGDVRYHGNPDIRRSVMGSGDIEPIR
ncbi:MAG: DUF2807 domain-containing protein [Rhodothermaceae bacterium]|nr:DUF2807 domain-containing protein [Rhodothermaceae bacterium]